jgi:peptidoglycan-N-acetylglucosamine deacetylase
MKLSFVKKAANASLLTMFLAIPGSCAGSVAAPYEVGTWEGFRPAAISYTFDDNLASQYSTAVPMFHAAGFKMTLNTVINYWTSFTWSQAQTAASYGDEIASHTVTHSSLNSVSASQLINELAGSKNTINFYITNESCATLAYPNCVVPDESVVAQYYIAARGCSGTLVPSTPSDFMNISSFILGNTGSYNTAANVNSLADGAVPANAWCVYLIHALDNDNGYSPLPSSVLQASVNYMSSNQDKFWVDTFGNVVRYIKERNASSVTETTNTGDSITVQVTDNLDNSIFNYPITLRRPLPTNWTWAAVSQNGAPVPTQVYTNNNFQLYVMFDVVPNGGDVTIAKILAPGSNFQLAIPQSATEGQGVLAGQGSVMINPAPTNDLVVNLTSSNTNKVTVPASVVIPAGQSNAVTFDLTIVDNGLLDGNQNVAITATATGYGSRQSTILVSNIHTATLSVTLPASATKGAGTLASAGTVSASSGVTSNYLVNLSSSDSSKLAVPATVIIPNGQTSAVFNLTVADNTLIDGPQTVSVTANVPGWTGGSKSMTINDYHTPPDHFVWSVVPSPQTAGQPFRATIIALDNNSYQVNFMLPVNLSAWAPGTAPATRNFLGSPGGDLYPDNSESTVGYSFTPGANLVATAVRSYFGDKVSIWTDGGVLLAAQRVASVEGSWVETPLTNAVVLLAGVIYRVGAHVTNNGTLYWTDNLATTFLDGTLNASWSVAGDAFPNGADSGQYLVDLRYGTNVVSVPVSPAVSGNFIYGNWSGSLAVLQPATGVTLQSSLPGHSGQSFPFNVQAGIPTLTITPQAGSVVISWPTSAVGFNLEQTASLSAGSWATGTNYPSVVGSNNVVTNTSTGATTFYRLHKP